uniref:Uncharacterized protein n=1 Tax=Lepeophtheirus salmonis TaxID=72036 RepID=A0A0K2SW85_LEPSM
MPSSIIIMQRYDSKIIFYISGELNRFNNCTYFLYKTKITIMYIKYSYTLLKFVDFIFDPRKLKLV